MEKLKDAHGGFRVLRKWPIERKERWAKATSCRAWGVVVRTSDLRI